MNAPVAQLDRATDYGSVGWGFESLRARHRFIEPFSFFNFSTKSMSLLLLKRPAFGILR